ncbi:hypothetical protein KUM39_05975 [Streptomyces sp. J2-1]|uniref:hypothetical protein n=1 Tax=Streptomyces corallincola TaxID=2851888 RepID=UPI001C3930DE|nr:hypothetical protein [Streptomyces corallincola]MBV2353910.1 hypothetical protein [Streptomyces corallincola]
MTGYIERPGDRCAVRTAKPFRLDVPDSWGPVDSCGTAFEKSRARVLAATDDPGERARIVALFRLGEEVVRTAREHGDLLAAGTASRSVHGLFMAYGAVFEVTAPEGQSAAISALSARLGVRADPGAVPEDRVVTWVDVPWVGRAVRITATEAAPAPAAPDTRLLTMHTMMPVPGVPGSYFVVTLVSPNLAMRNGIYDLFDAITSTFRYPAGLDTRP